MRVHRLTIRIAALGALTLLGLCGAVAPAHAAGELLWVRSRTDANIYSGADVAVDMDGNVIVATSSIENLPGGYWTYDDYLVVKYDPQGVELWSRTYDGSAGGHDLVAAVVVDGAGNVTVTGTSCDTNYQGDPSVIATVQYDASGNLRWVEEWDNLPDGIDRASDLIVDAAGNLYVVGTTDTHSRFPCYSLLATDFVAIKYGPQGGAPLWVATYDGPGQRLVYARRQDCDLYCVDELVPPAPVPEVIGGKDGANRVAVDASGNVTVTGSSQAAAQAGCTGTLYADDADCVGTTVAADCAGRNDYATVKYSSSGQQLWVARYDGPSHLDDGAAGVAVDASGNVFVTGTSNSSATGSDYLTVKYDASGAQQWTRAYTGYGGTRSEIAWAIAVDSQGRVTVTGSSDERSQSGCFFWYEHAQDIATIQYAANGTQRWAQRQGGSGSCSEDEGFGIAVDGSANVIVVGKTSGGVEQGDYTTVKYNANGQRQWTRTYANGFARAVAIGPQGHVHVAGNGVSGGPGLSTLKYNP
jgi:hypothetical protein